MRLPHSQGQGIYRPTNARPGWTLLVLMEWLLMVTAGLSC